jgi:hypothetical protein
MTILVASGSVSQVHTPLSLLPTLPFVFAHNLWNQRKRTPPSHKRPGTAMAIPLQTRLSLHTSAFFLQGAHRAALA